MKHSALPVHVIPFVIACVVGCVSCKSDPTVTTEVPYLKGPSVFIPVGLLRQPQGIAVDARGDVWVSDTRAQKIRRFAADGTHRDSLAGFQIPTRMGRDRSNNDVLVIDMTTISRITPASGHVSIIATLNSATVDGSSVFDVNDRSTTAVTVNVQSLGDIAGSQTGDLFVSAFGIPENFLIRVRSGLAAAVAASSLAPVNQAERGPYFCAVDAFGIVFSAFTMGGVQPLPRLYAFNPFTINLSHTVPEPFITGTARGADIDAAGNLYITDAAAQELIIVSTLSERTLGRYTIPDVDGHAMIPHDVAASENGLVYVVVSDRSGGEAGAVLRYERASR
ncbi:MAG TPA: hypothetical protein VNL69_06350 [Bacteroidota bacterium]|nr:hypothetical protein [Bacteroidota bacterium]